MVPAESLLDFKIDFLSSWTSLIDNMTINHWHYSKCVTNSLSSIVYKGDNVGYSHIHVKNR